MGNDRNQFEIDAVTFVMQELTFEIDRDPVVIDAMTFVM